MIQLNYSYNFSLLDIDNEIWGVVSGSNGRFMVSNMGRVKSVKKSWITWRGGVMSKPDVILKPRKSSAGYLSMKTTDTTIIIHRAVAEYFLEKEIGKNMVNHKNGVKTDNRVENLEWCTAKENCNHAKLLGLIPPSYWKGKKGGNHIASRKVICVTNNTKYNSLAEAAEALKITPSHISEVCSGVRKKTGGLIFKYI